MNNSDNKSFSVSYLYPSLHLFYFNFKYSLSSRFENPDKKKLRLYVNNFYIVLFLKRDTCFEY